MIRPAYVLAYIFAAACAVGAIDQRSAEVAHESAMEAPRPIFESATELKRLDMPCTYIQQTRFDHEAISAKNTRCTNADRRD